MDQQTAPNERQQYGEEFRGHTAVEKKRWRHLLEQRFPGVVAGVLSCYDRLMLQGTLPNICFAGGMEQYLRAQGIAYRDYTQWALPLADQIKRRAEALAAAEGIQIEFLRKKIRKEDHVQQLLAQRGDRPGLICILSAMERCDTYRFCRKEDGWGLRPDSGKCLHYYFYFLDPEWGLGFLRLPTWAPFRVQFYVNGHSWLALQLKRENIAYRLLDNALLGCADWTRAQQISDRLRVDQLHRQLDAWAQTYCPFLTQLHWYYHWSVDQAEYATDVVFRSPRELAQIYEPLTRLAVHTVKAQHIATFLGKKLNTNFQGEAGNRYDVRIQGTRIKHTMGPVSIKMYDKFGLLLRVETTVNDLTFFQHYRQVEQRDGQRVFKWAEMKRNIYSLPILRERCLAANWRYVESLCALADPTVGMPQLQRITQPIQQNHRNYPGFDFFSARDQPMLLTLLRGEFTIRGFANKDLRRHLPGKTSGQLSRFLKRLRLHGLARKIPRTYRYQLSLLGQTMIALAFKLKDLVIIPALAAFACP